ncbi:hypothetical protein EO213_16590 [Paracoccus denitrificans]|jgi:2-(1,2-epoxy-1,2-dihydrophenyl)acetyl-CoA isomerase|nr:hypothetical protein EO213_16590 [Paracoccus denitrificans]
MEMALTCAALDAGQAKDWELVAHVTTADDLLPRATELARAIAAHPPRSIRLNKRLLRNSTEMGLEAALDMAAAYQAIVQNTAD